jgi:hypothetical protein
MIRYGKATAVALGTFALVVGLTKHTRRRSCPRWREEPATTNPVDTPYTVFKHIVETNARTARAAALLVTLGFVLSVPALVVIATDMAPSPAELAAGAITAAAGLGWRIVDRSRRPR